MGSLAPSEDRAVQSANLPAKSEPVAQLGADFFRRGLRTPASHRGTRSIDEELLKVPRNLRAVTRAGLLLLEPLVERRSTVAVDIDLGEHRKVDVIFRRCELDDFRVGARLLTAELVAREGQNLEPIAAVLFFERTQTCVLRRQASTTRHVDDETDLTFKLREIQRGAINCIHRERGKGHFANLACPRPVPGERPEIEASHSAHKRTQGSVPLSSDGSLCLL